MLGSSMPPRDSIHSLLPHILGRQQNTQSFIIIFLMFSFLFEMASVGEGQREPDRGSEWSRLCTVSREPDTRARTHEPWDHDLSRSWTLNCLSHPGGPTPSPFLFPASVILEAPDARVKIQVCFNHKPSFATFLCTRLQTFLRVHKQTKRAS